MVQATPETLLISAMINTGDPNAGRSYGITDQHIRRYRDEYAWVRDYAQRYGKAPTLEKLKLAYPEFPFSPEEDDPRWSSQEIHETYAKQQMTKSLLRASELVHDGKTKEAYAEFEGLKYSEVSAKPTNMLVDPGYLDDFDRGEENRIELPWPTPQGLTGGIGEGELWYWLARQGHGKSSDLVTIAVNAACQGSRVLFYGLEMTKRQIQVRAHATMGHRLGWGDKIDAHAMLHKTYDRALYRELLELIEENLAGELHVHDMTAGRVTPGALMGRADDYDLLVVDHVGLMYTDGGQRSIGDWRYAAEISNGLKEVAGAKSTRVLGAVQINREGDQPGRWQPPTLKQASQTDAIGQDADVAVTKKRYGRTASVMSLEKNRHGEGGRRFWSKYDPNRGDFTEITREKADDLKAESDAEYDED